MMDNNSQKQPEIIEAVDVHPLSRKSGYALSG